MNAPHLTAIIYTDGSCHTQTLAGGWAAVILVNNKEIVISGKASHTTHHRMELTAVINAIEYVKDTFKEIMYIHIYADSQYVIGLTSRKETLTKNNFLTKKGEEIRNADLVKVFLEQLATSDITFTKVKAHQKNENTSAYNTMVDKLSRSIVREQ